VRTTRAHLTGSIPRVLPVAFVSSEFISSVGGVAAAMAIGAFLGQAQPRSIKGSDEVRRRNTAFGGLIGIVVMIGFILLSPGGR
jgi:hypothetical protein